MSRTAYLSLGSNIGDARGNLTEAADALTLVPGVTVEKISGFYITRPWGYSEQPDFTNICIRLSCTLSAPALLGACLGIEAAMGRHRSIKNGPRIIDIDLILYEDYTSDTDELRLPHPGMTQREFVLRPLLDVCDDGKALDFDVEKALKALTDL